MESLRATEFFGSDALRHSLQRQLAALLRAANDVSSMFASEPPPPGEAQMMEALAAGQPLLRGEVPAPELRRAFAAAAFHALSDNIIREVVELLLLMSAPLCSRWRTCCLR